MRHCGGITLDCDDDARRLLVDTKGANGIEAVEVRYDANPKPLAPTTVLVVTFFAGVPAGIDAKHVAITGGVRVPGPTLHVTGVATVTVTGVDHLEITLDRFGDHSTYALAIDAGLHPLDPAYACKTFRFTVDCPDPFDCKPPAPFPPPLPADPPLDYLAKDYLSFRRALLDFLPTRVPGFDETNEADLGVTLAELFAYAGDLLSYFQDAVNNEKYLRTARRRVSVKRHARLVDYGMHEGAAATTLLQFSVAATVASPATLPAAFAVTTDETDPARRTTFETLADAKLFFEQNPAAAMAPYTWGNATCCIEQGATSLDVEGSRPSLDAGTMLLIEEVLTPYDEGGSTVLDSPPDPTHRCVVTLDAKPSTFIDGLTGATVTRLTWGSADALPFAFCAERTAKGPATLVSGNLVPASHGRSVLKEPFVPGAPLLEAPLTWLAGASGDPRGATSSVALEIVTEAWHEVSSLLDSGPDDPDFVVDVDGDGRGTLRFGTGDGLGRPLPVPVPVGTSTLSYRIGNGAAGNVGRETLVQLAPSAAALGVTAVRNPFPATGGTDPEPIADVQRDAPQAFRAVQYRAVTADDYAAAAKLVPGIADAIATFRWTGSWLTVFVLVDPQGRTTLDATLHDAVIAQLDAYRQAGYDLEIRPPSYVALDIALTVCVQPNYLRADVLAAVLDALASGPRRDGGLGFFAPGTFSFGGGVALSRLYAAVQAVPGVLAVHATRFRRYGEDDHGALADGLIALGPFEIARLDRDPDAPDNGVLAIDLDGGR
jgi:hypothetical protein